MWLALKLKQAVSAHDPGRGLMLADYRARLVASLALMIRGDRYFSVINATARRYFNDGVTPPRLPRLRTVEVAMEVVASIAPGSLTGRWPLQK